jgi:hypothetical protein
VGTGADDPAIQAVDEVCRFRGGTGGHLHDGFKAMLWIARVDPFGL